MRSRLFRRWMGPLRRWPLHPQWLLATGAERRELRAALARFHGCVLDVGCADRHLATWLPARCNYVGLDYPDTAIQMYHTRPDLYADAGAIPLATASVDAVILKDVLEHVRGPDAALAEIARVLVDGGQLLLWIPFMYPIHDAPHDFQRFTEHGLRAYLADHGFGVDELRPVLRPVETAARFICLALADAAEQIVVRRRWLLPLLPLLATMVVLVNLVGKVLSWLPSTHFMPAFYRVLAVRVKQTPGIAA